MDKFRCKICRQYSHGEIFEVKEMMFGSGEVFQYTACKKCETIQLITPPEDMSYYYPDEYYAYTPISLSTFQVHWLKTLRFELFIRWGLDFLKPIYADWLKHLKVNKADKIADIGCGNGQLLYELYASGFRFLEGFDPFLKETMIINKCMVLHKKSLAEIHGQFHVIMLHHAFEHMENPAESFSQISDLLYPGGKLLIRIPVSDGLAWEIYRENWVQLDAPRHHFIPSKKAMEILADQTGLEIYRIEWDSNAFQFWASELYAKGIPFYGETSRKLISKEDFIRFKKKSLQLNKEGKGDQAAFYFRKPLN
ncbi:MAG: class I SAM-dependent methyltransferase [Cyclobacteriaceae bacterium]